MMISFFLLNELNFCKRKKTYHYRCYWRKYNGKKTFFFLLLYLENIIIKRSFSISTCTMFFFFVCFIFVILIDSNFFFFKILYEQPEHGYHHMDHAMDHRYVCFGSHHLFACFVLFVCLSIFHGAKWKTFFFSVCFIHQ